VPGLGYQHDCRAARRAAHPWRYWQRSVTIHWLALQGRRPNALPLFGAVLSLVMVSPTSSEGITGLGLRLGCVARHCRR
jgi:hypothetical protein